MPVLHSILIDGKLHVPGYVQDADPGAVGAGMIWIDTSRGADAFEPKIRNDADDGWRTAEFSEIQVGHIDFDLEPTATPAEGRMFWNEEDGTLNLGMPGGNVNLQLGQEMVIRCRNATGAEIPNGTPVYQVGASGNRPLIDLADADSILTSYVVGVTTEAIDNNENGYVSTRGLVRDVNTSSWPVGTPLWLSQTAGEFTAIRPIAPAISVFLGQVIAQHATTGVIGVRPTVVPRLIALSDVYTEAPEDGDYLRWWSDTSRFELVSLKGLEYFFNGTFKESFNALATSDGVTVTMSLEKSGGGDLTMKFSDGLFDLDCTPAQTIALTAGSDSSPTPNYIYIPQSTKVLTKSTTQWPSAEHVKVAYFLVPSAVEVQNEGCFINQNWNDHRSGSDNQGHLSHITETIRLTMGGAKWDSGVGPNASGGEYLEVTGTSPSVVEFKSTSGVSYQMHKHTIPAIDMSAGDDAHVANWDGDSYHEVSDLADIVADANGVSLSNRWFNLIFWGVANKTGEYAPLMINLPTGSYVTQASAEGDVDGYDVTSIPREFIHDSTTGFLVCRVTCKQTPAGTWSLGATKDLRGVAVGASAGSGGAGGSVTEFADNQFKVFNVSDITKILALSLAGITTGNTRTLTVPDASGTIELEGHTHTESDITDLDHNDTDAIHLSVASELHSGLAKVAVDASDEILIEDNSDSWAKKVIAASDFSFSGHTHIESEITDLDHNDTNAIHDNVAAEINAITAKATPTASDILLIEDAAASNAKKKITIGDLPSSGGGGGVPVTTAVTEVTGTTTGTTYTTVVNETSGGPYMLFIVENQDASGYLYTKVTVDGTYVIELPYVVGSGSMSVGPGSSHPAPIFCETSLKVEVKNAGIGGLTDFSIVYNDWELSA